MKSCIMWVVTIRFKYIDLVVGSCRFAIEEMFNKTTTTNQFRQPIDGIHDQIQLHLIFMLQMWNICGVCISCCNHVTCAKHARGYTCEKKKI